MKLKIIHLTTMLLCLITLLSGCTNPNPTNDKDDEDQSALKDIQIQDLQANLKDQAALATQLQNENVTLKQEIDQLNQPIQVSTITPLSQALTVIQLLKAQDMITLSEVIHPTKGVRFSPYGYTDEANNLIFTQAQMPTLMEDTQTYTWGSYDGTGDPIIKSFADYYEEFVYDEDFSNPQVIGNNMVIGTGNSLINITEAYPEGVFVEFHFKGFDLQYEGMDWVSLRLVFEELNGEWYLVGIIHDQWTI